jgi:hypothetical protein
VELDRDALRALHAVMPRSTVELARAVRERGLPIEEADAIARYLVRVVEVLKRARFIHAYFVGAERPAPLAARVSPAREDARRCGAALS